MQEEGKGGGGEEQEEVKSGGKAPRRMQSTFPSPVLSEVLCLRERQQRGLDKGEGQHALTCPIKRDECMSCLTDGSILTRPPAPQGVGHRTSGGPRRASRGACGGQVLSHPRPPSSLP